MVGGSGFMHTEIFNNIDLLVEMAGSNVNEQDLETDLTQINKDIQDKKQRLDDLKSIMNDTRYFNASSELVDKNIEVSLKSKITRLNRKIKELDFELKGVKADEAKLARELDRLNEKIEENRKYVSILDEKNKDQVSDAYQNIVSNEKEHTKKLEEELEHKTKKHDAILKEIELHEQAKNELLEKKSNDEARLKEVQDNLNNPNTYIDEDLKAQDEKELQSLNDSLDELQKKKLEYLTDPNMIGADAKELISNNNYTEALNKIKELLEIVKSKPFMDITNLSVLDEELEKKESERTELSNYIDTKNYASVDSDVVSKRVDYLNKGIEAQKGESSQYESFINRITEDINQNLSVFIRDVEEEIALVSKDLEEYQELAKDSSKSRRTKANLENAILKKEKEKQVLEDLLASYKKDLLFQITVSNAIHKIVSKYNQNIAEHTKEIEELQHLQIMDEVNKDYIEEERDKEKLKIINEEIKQIKNRQKFDKTPDEIYDQIEMLLGTMNTPSVERPKEEVEETLDTQIDDLFSEEDGDDFIKVVDMIPAQTVQSNGGTSYGA